MANTITFEDLETAEPDVPEQDNFHQEFLKKIKGEKEAVKPKKEELLINDDEDKFMKDLEIQMGGGEADLLTSAADRELEKERKRQLKADLGFYDNSDFEPINKCLYIESKEVTEMSIKEVNEFRKGYGDIKVRGINCAKPIQNWY